VPSLGTSDRNNDSEKLIKSRAHRQEPDAVLQQSTRDRKKHLISNTLSVCVYIGWNWKAMVIKPVYVRMCEPAVPQAAQISVVFTKDRRSSSAAAAGAP
jgi:hypothetical protein